MAMNGRQAERLIYRGLLLIMIVTVSGLSLWPAQTWFASKSADPHAHCAVLLSFLEQGYPLAALALAALTGLALAGFVSRRHSSGRIRPILARAHWWEQRPSSGCLSPKARRRFISRGFIGSSTGHDGR